jgi:hypothetical protein
MEYSGDRSMVSYGLSTRIDEEISSKIDFELISSIYKELTAMYYVPSSEAIFNHYNMVLEHRLTELQATLYPDDVYEGKPGQAYSPTVLPDYVTADLQQYIHMEPVTLEDVESCLECYHLFFIREERDYQNEYINPIILEVW